ncbi:MAG: hypothetical protein AAF798_17535 [Bacteroidota bacterium]
MSQYTILFYLLIFILAIGVLQSIFIGGLFFWKRTGSKRANQFYGTLLITIGLTLLHHIFDMTHFYESYPQLYFLPIYFTLSLPMLFFYAVKFNLYPSYQLRWTDMKHFILPVGQWLFFVYLFFTTVDYKSGVDRHFYNPFYGAFEQFLYLTTFYAYMYFAYRYLNERQRKSTDKKERPKLLYLRALLRIFFVLFCIHTIFVLADFFSYELLDINFRTVKAYAALMALSFAALVFWLGIYGFQVLFWGRRIFSLSS